METTLFYSFTHPFILCQHVVEAAQQLVLALYVFSHSGAVQQKRFVQPRRQNTLRIIVVSFIFHMHHINISTIGVVSRSD